MKFLEYVVNDLFTRFNGDFQDVVFVLPTRRAGIFVRDYLGELATERPIYAPQCITIADLFERLCSLRPADEIKSTCLLYRIFSENYKTTLTLDAFYGWGRQLIADFNNIEKGAEEYSVHKMLQNSMEARHFDESKLDKEVKERLRGLFRNVEFVQEDEDSFRKDYEILWRQLPEIHRQLTEALRKDGCALEGARYRQVVENFDDLVSRIVGRKYVFIGFNRLLAVERQLMTKMKEHNLALFYWDYDRAFDEDEDSINVYGNIRKNIWRDEAKSLDNLGGLYEDSNNDAREPIEIVAASSDSAQARYVYDWLLANHHEGERTAIVICNESQLEHVVFAIPPQMADNVNITKGFPLRNTRIYADIVRRLRDKRDDASDFDAVLQSLLDYIDNSLHVSTIEDEHDTSQADLPWHELLAIESAYQSRLAVVKFRQLIADGTLADVQEFRTLRNLLLRHLGTISIPFHGEPITDIQIIGVLETRALDFDNILFLNVEEGVIPKVGKDKSFLPYYLRKYYGLPTNDEQTEIFAYNFFRLLRRAHRVTILYCDAQTANGQKTMSRFVMQMLVSKRFDTVRRRLADSTALPEVITSAQAYRRLRDLLPDKCYADILKEQTNDNNVATLSPSAVKTFLTCPAKFYICYMLRVPEPDTDDTLLQGNELGTLIHNSAEVAYKNITDNYTKPLTPEAIKAFRTNPVGIRRAIVEAFEMMNEDYRTRHGNDEKEHYKRAEHRVEAGVARKHLKKILENDENTPGLNIITCERDVFYKAEVRGMPVRIGGRIDRMDSVLDSHDGLRAVRVVDYKTGKFHAENMKAKTLDELFYVGQTAGGNFLQTLIYSLAASEDKEMQRFIHSAASFYPVLLYTQKGLDSFDPRLFLGANPLTDFNAIKAEFEAKLLALVDQILYTQDFPMVGTDEFVQMAGGTTAKSNKSPCEYCKYTLLCARKSSR
ncbi:MAG: PD-(D/E)XK nuclease family protein [Prevotellaceae bacterium]|nr:PD-(D/E)XK nuclease family protein [Prevotellaceae bacterium]